MREITTVLTIIDGMPCKFTGKLSKDKKILKCSKGMILTIEPTDKVTTEQIITRTRAATPQPLLDMHAWFRANKKL